MKKININSWKNRAVLVIGDLMLDRYWYGSVNRISPEAPVPIFDYKKEENRLGGAANVALNLESLGCKVFLSGVLGQDADADIFKNIIHKNKNININGIVVDKNRPTTVKTRLWSNHQQILRIDHEENKEISSFIEDELITNIISIIHNNKIELVIFQDYNKGVLSHNLIQAIIDITKEKAIKTTVDPKSQCFYEYAHVDLFKPNLKEVREQVPFQVAPNINDLTKAAEYIRNKMPHYITMITLSDKGIFLYNGKKGVICPTQKREIIDVCGAGDSVLSVASMSILENNNLEQIGHLSNITGGQVCTKMGVVPLDLEELQAEWNDL